MITTVKNESLLTSYRVEWLWYLVQENPRFTRQLYIRAETKKKAIEHAVSWGVTRDQIAQVSEWGFNLDSPGVVLSLWRETGAEIVQRWLDEETNDEH